MDDLTEKVEEKQQILCTILEDYCTNFKYGAVMLDPFLGNIMGNDKDLLRQSVDLMLDKLGYIPIWGDLANEVTLPISLVELDALSQIFSGAEEAPEDKQNG